MAKAVINLQKESGGIVKISSVDGVGVTELSVPESGNLVSVDTAVTDNAIARYDGTTGKLQNSLITVSDTGIITVPTDSGGTSIQSKGRASDDSSGVYFLNNSGIEELGNLGRRGSSVPPTMSYNAHKVGAFHEWRIENARKMILDNSGNLLLVSGTGALGYGTGAGGTVTQLTSKSTAVTLNKPTGRITMHNAALAAGASVTFTVNNSIVSGAANDYIGITNQYGNADGGAYRVEVQNVSVSRFDIRVTNISASSLSTSITLIFVVIKGAVS